MAGEQEPHTNGLNGDASDDEDDQKNMRPVDIEADVKEMERRKRVEAIMNSQLFREELERVVGDSLRESGSDSLAGLISDVMNIKTGTSANPSHCVVPINDIRGIDSMVYAKGEKLLRCKLAAVYRLIELYGWTQGIYNHVTARVSQDTEHFLLNPFGMLYSEVTASSLVKVNMQGDCVEEGTTNFGVNQAGFMLHSAIHQARPDIKCIIHLHTPNLVAVSTMKCGLLPLSQETCLVGEVSYHNYNGIVIDPEERESLAKDLGPSNKVMFLRNHGVVCCGKSIEEAWLNTYHVVLAADTQIKMMPMGLDNLVLIDDDVRRKTYEIGQKGGGGVNTAKKEWGVGELEFEALMRMLDNSGYRTGYAYAEPLVRKEPAKMISDVELPPTASNLGYLMDEEELYKDGPLRALLAQMGKATRSGNKTRWVNSPNVYQKVEVLETGTQDPKKITKWVADGSPSHSTPVKIETSNQFVPMGSDPKEFRRVQKLMKEGRRLGGVHAGPESKVLDGLSWEEARQMADAQVSHVDGGYMKVGAASKGIIQRDFQHNATVYKSPYAKNPFDMVSNEELEEYKRIINNKTKRDDGAMSPTSPTLDDTMGDTTDAGEMTSPGPGPMSPATDTEHEGIQEVMVSQGRHPRSSTPSKEYIGESGEHTNYETDGDGNRTFSEGEGDTSRADDPDSVLSPKKEKKKKVLKTPSFLKKKKKDKKEKEKA